MDSKIKVRPRKFIKMYGTGNDFVVLPALDWRPAIGLKFIRETLNRRRGIGGDQLLIISCSRAADFKLSSFNPDGSEAEMCGNGMRCAAKYLHDAKMAAKREITFETLSGIKKTKMLGRHSYVVDFGEPIMKGKDIPVNLSGRVINRQIRIDTKELKVTCLSMGNPHCILFVDDLDNHPVEKTGPLLENHHIFPKRINVEFVQVISPGELKMRVWERGVGETDGCGTGAAAAAVAGVLNGVTERKATVTQRGGKVDVNWDKKTGHVFQTGTAQVVFEGEILM